MKTFTHSWDEDIFLLHIQLNTEQNSIKNTIKLIRSFKNSEKQQEEIMIDNDSSSYRFIVSRSHPNELGMSILYSSEITLTAFKIDDRAYYPTEPFYQQ